MSDNSDRGMTQEGAKAQQTNHREVYSGRSQEIEHGLDEQDSCEKLPGVSDQKAGDDMARAKIEVIGKCPIDAEKALHLLNTVKNFVNDSFTSHGVIAQLIKQDGEDPFLNVSLLYDLTSHNLFGSRGVGKLDVIYKRKTHAVSQKH